MKAIATWAARFGSPSSVTAPSDQDAAGAWAVLIAEVSASLQRMHASDRHMDRLIAQRQDEWKKRDSEPEKPEHGQVCLMVFVRPRGFGRTLLPAYDPSLMTRLLELPFHDVGFVPQFSAAGLDSDGTGYVALSSAPPDRTPNKTFKVREDGLIFYEERHLLHQDAIWPERFEVVVPRVIANSATLLVPLLADHRVQVKTILVGARNKRLQSDRRPALMEEEYRYDGPDPFTHECEMAATDLFARCEEYALSMLTRFCLGCHLPLAGGWSPSRMG